MFINGRKMAIVKLSEQSQALIAQLNQIDASLIPSAWSTLEVGERSEVIAWLSCRTQGEADNNSRFFLESLRISLLDDLQNSFLTPKELEAKQQKHHANQFNQAGFIALIIAGSMVAICEGFDGVASILGLFAAIPTIAIFAAGVVFSLLSLSLFYAFELREISQRAGVNLSKSRQLLDIFLQQVEQINEIKKIIGRRFTERLSEDERMELRWIIIMLEDRYKALDKDREYYLAVMNKPGLKIARFITAGMAAILFFSSGYFTGQTLALTVGSLFVASIVPTFWPVIVASAAVGLAALVLYWAVYRSSLENLVGQWMGLGRENIEAFADSDVVTQQKQELERLETQLGSIESMQAEIAETSAMRHTTPSTNHPPTTSPGFFRPRAQSWPGPGGSVQAAHLRSMSRGGEEPQHGPALM
jgi:hypothetical protein